LGLIADKEILKMKINGIESSQILTSILENLYRKLENPPTNLTFAIKVIDSPDVAKAIFLAPNLFVKNYSFIEKLSKGRFSANGEDWKQRASISQSFFPQAHIVLGDEALEAIYRKHLLAYLNNPTPNLYETIVDAALEVVSQVLGLQHPIPWPTTLVNRARQALIDQQAMAWFNADASLMQQSQMELNTIFSELQALWEDDVALVNLLNSFAVRGKSIANFSPAGELVQILFASTETTASSILWIIECLTRHSEIQMSDDDELEYFIDEVLRLFPPVPFVTRVCLEDVEINGVYFAKNEPIIISIIGIHCHPKYWSEPMLFKVRREEFVNGSYARQAYIPFLSGPRACAGMKLAKQEVKSGIRALLELFNINPCYEDRVIEYGISSRPSIKLESYLIPHG
jgi:cytochrome P450